MEADWSDSRLTPGSTGVVLCSMMHKEGPDRLGAARRHAVQQWLIRQGMAAAAADSWCDAWEAQATGRGLHPQSVDFWEGAGLWIAERLKSRQPPV